MIQRRTMEILSPAMITEIKHFVRREGTYKAKQGATDDLISSALIVLRLLEEISSFDQDAYDKIFRPEYFETGEVEDFDESYEPDPIVI